MPNDLSYKNMRSWVSQIRFHASQRSIGHMIGPPLVLLGDAAHTDGNTPTDQDVVDNIEDAADTDQAMPDSGESEEYVNDVVGSLCDFGTALGLEPTAYCADLSALWSGCSEFEPPQEWLNTLASASYDTKKAKTAHFMAMLGLWLYYVARHVAGDAAAGSATMTKGLSNWWKAKNLAIWGAHVCFLESKYSPNAHNNIGAEGYWQMLPGTRQSIYAGRADSKNPLPPWPDTQTNTVNATLCTQARYAASLFATWTVVFSTRIERKDAGVLIWHRKDNEHYATRESQIEANILACVKAVNELGDPSLEMIAAIFTRYCWWQGPQKQGLIEDWLSPGHSGWRFMSALRELGFEERHAQKDIILILDHGDDDQDVPKAIPDYVPEEGPVSEEEEQQEQSQPEPEKGLIVPSYPPFDTELIQWEPQTVQEAIDQQPDAGSIEWADSAYDQIYGEAAPRPIIATYTNASDYIEARERLLALAVKIPQPVPEDQPDPEELGFGPPPDGGMLALLKRDVLAAHPWFTADQYIGTVLVRTYPGLKGTAIINNVDAGTWAIQPFTKDGVQHSPSEQWAALTQQLQDYYTSELVNENAVKNASPPNVEESDVLAEHDKLIEQFHEDGPLTAELFFAGNPDLFTRSDFVYRSFSVRQKGPWTIDPSVKSHGEWQDFWLDIKNLLKKERP